MLGFQSHLNHLFSAPLFVTIARNRAFKRAIDDIRALPGRMIAEGRQNPPLSAQLLAMMLEA